MVVPGLLWAVLYVSHLSDFKGLSSDEPCFAMDGWNLISWADFHGQQVAYNLLKLQGISLIYPVSLNK